MLSCYYLTELNVLVSREKNADWTLLRTLCNGDTEKIIQSSCCCICPLIFFACWRFILLLLKWPSAFYLYSSFFCLWLFVFLSWLCLGVDDPFCFEQNDPPPSPSHSRKIKVAIWHLYFLYLYLSFCLYLCLPCWRPILLPTKWPSLSHSWKIKVAL